MIKIQVITYNEVPLSHQLSANFDELGGNIGRADDNALVLPDPEKHISRLHASITYRDGKFFIRNLGSATPVYLNDQPLDYGQDEPIAADDKIRIGDYTMQVVSEEIVNPIFDRPSTEPKNEPPNLPVNQSINETFFDLLNYPEKGFTEIINSAEKEKPSAKSPSDIIPPDYDPWKNTIPASSEKPQSKPQTPKKRSIDDSPAVQSTADQEELLRAFLIGAGVPDIDIPKELTPEFMELIGQLLRESTKGTLDLLVARAHVKKEMGSHNLTIIEPKNNNPLKFSPNVEAALTHLLSPKGRGFMAPLPAMRNAYDDLRSHQFGFMAGMRAALSGVLERFKPQKLEERMPQKTRMDSLFPMKRKAKLWNLFTERYNEISDASEEDFRALFGKEFWQAYKEVVNRKQDNEKI